MLKRLASLRLPNWRSATRTLFTIAVSSLTLAALVRPTEDAVANGDTRSLSMVHMHTGETINIVYKRDGRYDQDALKKLNWFLRDWRREEPTRMDPRLFDTIWLAYRDVRATQPIHVLCGYRAPETNAMLRRRSRGVAKFSQHTLGKAMDFYIPGVDLSRLRVTGLRLQRGGVGFYPTSGSPFVHMDAGSVRMWPKMTRTQLAAVFPDGKTVHIPSDGKPMPGYQLAFAEVMRNGGSVGGYQGGGDDDGGSDAGSGARGGSLFAALFGNGASSAPAARSNTVSNVAVASAAPARIAPAPVPAAAPQPAPEPAPVVVAQQTPRIIPLPEPRPAELNAPVLAWQAGPQPAAVQSLQQVAALDVPLPPARPGEDEPEDVPAPVQISADADSVPLPPQPPVLLRPDAPVLADLASTGPTPFRSPAPSKFQERALSFAAADTPLTLPQAAERPDLVSTRFEKLNFAAMAAPVAAARDPAQAGLVRPKLETVATLIPAPAKMVVMRFGVSAYQDLRTEKFTGAAIRPLKTASFALAPDIITGSIPRRVAAN